MFGNSMHGIIILYEKRIEYILSRKKSKKVTSYLLNRKIFKIYYLNHKI